MTSETFAPGRVELLGNHTDYNGGVVLSAALDLGITARGHATEGHKIRLHTEGDHDFVSASLERLAPSGGWQDYPLGVASEFLRAGFPIGGFEVEFTSSLPSGAGLSSSAAIEVATALLLRQLFNLGLGPMEAAKICRMAENNFVGVRCGLLDQATSVFGKKEHVVFLDCRDESVRTVPFPGDAGLLIINSEVKHALTGGEYNERRDMCFKAAEILGVPALRDADHAALAKADMEDVVRRRAAHIVGENKRVFEAVEHLRKGDSQAFGALMSASHESSRVNFENSTPELDLLVELALDTPGIHGARLTGGGFGGAIVAIGEKSSLSQAGKTIAQQYRQCTGRSPKPLSCIPGDGAWVKAGLDATP